MNDLWFVGSILVAVISGVFSIISLIVKRDTDVKMNQIQNNNIEIVENEARNLEGIKSCNEAIEYIVSDDYNKAVEILATAKFGSGLEGVRTLLRAKCYEFLDRSDESVALVQHMIDLSPMNPSLHLYLGKIYYRKFLFGSAEFHFRQAVELRPRSAFSYKMLSKTLYLLGKYAESRDVCSVLESKFNDTTHLELKNLCSTLIVNDTLPPEMRKVDEIAQLYRQIFNFIKGDDLPAANRTLRVIAERLNGGSQYFYIVPQLYLLMLKSEIPESEVHRSIQVSVDEAKEKLLGNKEIAHLYSLVALSGFISMDFRSALNWYKKALEHEGSNSDLKYNLLVTTIYNSMTYNKEEYTRLSSIRANNRDFIGLNTVIDRILVSYTADIGVGSNASSFQINELFVKCIEPGCDLAFIERYQDRFIAFHNHLTIQKKQPRKKKSANI